jgi:ADP-heptose:LPS heptosyltransferase
MTTILRPIAAAVRASFARTQHLTDTLTLVTLAGGLLAALGPVAWVVAVGPAVVVWLTVPELLAPVRASAAASATPLRRVAAWVLTVDGPHAIAIVWLLSRVVLGVGWVGLARVLAAATAAFFVPRILLPRLIRRYNPSQRPRPRSIVLQRSDVLGDFVMATACLTVVHEAAPDTRVAWLCRASNTELMDGHPLTSVLVVDPTVEGTRVRAGIRRRQWRELATRLATHRFDAFVSLWDRPSLVYQLAAWKAGIPLRVGNLIAERAGWLFHGGAAVGLDPTAHEVESNLRQVEALGFPVQGFPVLWLGRSPDAEFRADALFAEHGIPTGARFVALSPATSGANRRLEAATYAAVVRHARNVYHTPTLILGGPSDVSLADDILASSPSGTVSLAGRTSTGVLAAVIRRSRMHVGCDSGPAHVAAAVGVPSVVISAAKAQKPLRWGPWMAPHRTVRRRSRCPLVCRPVSCTADFCVRAISALDLTDAFDAVWRDDVVVEPRDGRRSWAALSLSPIVHATGDSASRGTALDALRALRDAGFMEFALACPRDSSLAREAAAEEFDVRGADLGSLLDVLIEFHGGPVYDVALHASVVVRMALLLATPSCPGVRPQRVQALEGATSGAALTDYLLRALRPVSVS